MLKLKNITKNYSVGGETLPALRGIDIEFRENEFVSILGPSGCGKTTLLNIIGGLDKYTDGDLVINGTSTKEYKSSDWDAYRNHSIGFVFQTYNLIPHQTVLANVELALTISGVSKSERRKRAIDALEKVGLGNQIKKKPNQMSGGQMQRVAIARALVNDPDILLADEPTGALDSATSVQVMDLLKEVAKDRLVIMVTHNPELADMYSSRIVKLMDGKIVSDSNPYNASTVEAGSEIKSDAKAKKSKKPSMSFFTALSLSLNNLMTKKTRTILTSFAGSIGIIGIALILSVSNGVNTYINRVQQDTLSSYPIVLESESIDMGTMIGTLMDANKSDENRDHELDAVYSNTIMYELMNSLNNMDTQKNNLNLFKKHIETNDKFKELSEAIQYSYALDMPIYTKDSDGNIVKSDLTKLITMMYGDMAESSMNGTFSSMFTNFSVWEEMLEGKDGEIINKVLYDQYDVLYGEWPENTNEVVIVVDENNEVSDTILYALGLKTEQEMYDVYSAMMSGETIENTDTEKWSYEEICGLEFKIILPADKYVKQNDGTYQDFTKTSAGLEVLYNSDNAISLKVSAIIRPSSDSVASMMTGSMGYTSALTDMIIKRNLESEIVKDQLENPDTDIITGLPFESDKNELSDLEKKEAVKAYFASLKPAEQSVLYTDIMTTPSPDTLSGMVNSALQGMSDDDKIALLIKSFAQQTGMSEEQLKPSVESMDEQTKNTYINEIMTQMMKEQAKAQAGTQFSQMTAEEIISTFNSLEFSDSEYAYLYDTYMPSSVSESTYDDNLKLIGYVDQDSPSKISIHAATFENKEAMDDLISEYNKTVNDEDKIQYTDYVALMMSSVSTVLNAITYVLIAFVAISLVVSSIMIGIITYISVLERTKEIGVLRAIGASKKDVSRVFNAETLIVGFTAGALGIIITLLLLIPINLILYHFTGIGILSASLPVAGAIILVVISMILTLISGLIPSKIASKKDPVVALRTE